MKEGESHMASPLFLCPELKPAPRKGFLSVYSIYILPGLMNHTRQDVYAAQKITAA